MWARHIHTVMTDHECFLLSVYVCIFLCVIIRVLAGKIERMYLIECIFHMSIQVLQKTTGIVDPKKLQKERPQMRFML